MAKTTRAADTAAKTAETAADRANETVQQGARAFQDAAQRMTGASNEALKETFEKSLDTLNQLNDVSKRNL